MEKDFKINVRTFVFELSQLESGEADRTVNDFCNRHDVRSVIMGDTRGKHTYKVVFKL